MSESQPTGKVMSSALATLSSILRAIEERLATLRPTGKGRDLNYHRQVTSLKALRALILPSSWSCTSAATVSRNGYAGTGRTVDLPAAIGKILLTKPTRWADFDMSPKVVAALAGMPAKAEARCSPGATARMFTTPWTRWRPRV